MPHDHASQSLLSIRHSGRGLVMPCLALLLTVNGCAFNPFGPGQAAAPVPPPREADQWQLVTHVNSNARRIAAWRCNDATISAKGMPARLDAKIAVESPQRFRLVASSFAGNEADFGSNDERFWFWMRRGEAKNVFTVGHDDFQRLGPRLQIPFQPDWLMEVLGIAQLDAGEYRMSHDDPQRRMARLTADRLTPDGRTVQRSIVIDTKTGVIVEHSLYDGGGKLMARALLSGHQVHQPSGATMPQQVQLEWPLAGIEMTLALGKVEVNPPNLSERTWEIPTIPDSPAMDLGAMYDRSRGVRPAGF
ncbi:MAG: hypothetical protein WD066_12930 [Planctomycetaceae bacterium]